MYHIEKYVTEVWEGGWHQMNTKARHNIGGNFFFIRQNPKQCHNSMTTNTLLRTTRKPNDRNTTSNNTTGNNHSKTPREQQQQSQPKACSEFCREKCFGCFQMENLQIFFHLSAMKVATVTEQESFWNSVELQDYLTCLYLTCLCTSSSFCMLKIRRKFA